MPLDPKDLAALKEAAGIDEAHTLVATIRAFRTGDVGGAQPIRIEVWDMGEGLARYSVRAHDDDGRLLAFGNSRDTIYGAIRAVHWADLDKPARQK